MRVNGSGEESLPSGSRRKDDDASGTAAAVAASAASAPPPTVAPSQVASREAAWRRPEATAAALPAYGEPVEAEDATASLSDAESSAGGGASSRRGVGDDGDDGDDGEGGHARDSDGGSAGSEAAGGGSDDDDAAAAAAWLPWGLTPARMRTVTVRPGRQSAAARPVVWGLIREGASALIRGGGGEAAAAAAAAACADKV